MSDELPRWVVSGFGDEFIEKMRLFHPELADYVEALESDAAEGRVLARLRKAQPRDRDHAVVLRALLRPEVS